MYTAKHLYRFLTACSGNWRNSIYISSDGPSYLLSADRDARPVIMSTERFQSLTGEHIGPSECCGQLSEDAFRTLYAQYYLWQMPSAEDRPLP